MLTTSEAKWPEELDAMVAAPGHHVVMVENDAVRVLDTRVLPGETVPLHTHRWPAVQYVVSWGDFIRRDEAGVVLLDSRTLQRPAQGTALWSGPTGAHTLENIGDSELHVVSVEVKQAGSSRMGQV
jgi:hypothetical protein